MKLKARDKIGELEESLEIVLDEALSVMNEFAQKAKKFRTLKPTSNDYIGRYGDLAALAFLLKLKADAVHETLEQIIEEQSDEV